MKRPRIFLVCTGLGLVQRGFETYMADLSEKLQTQDTLFQSILYTGGKYKDKTIKSKQLFCISRKNQFWTNLFGESFTAEFELSSFFVSLLLEIIFKKPNAIYLGEYKLYCYLFKIRKLFRLNFSLILYTGGQVSPGLYNIEKDYVHHITDVYYDDLIKSGYPKEKQFILPHFVSMVEESNSINNEVVHNKAGEKKIIISVGVIDSTIKRMDQFVKVLSFLFHL